jgi:Arc/MetJ-type ribon-helix-helix transcriptional regulator
MTTKIAVSLPDEQVAEARAAVAAGRAASVSAYVSEALGRRSADEELLALLAEDDERYGPPSAEDYARAREALGLPPETIGHGSGPAA